MSRTKKEGLGLQKIYIKIIQKLTSIKGPPVAIVKGFEQGVPCLLHHLSDFIWCYV